LKCVNTRGLANVLVRSYFSLVAPLFDALRWIATLLQGNIFVGNKRRCISD
jgi:hypothetical protein